VMFRNILYFCQIRHHEPHRSHRVPGLTEIERLHQLQQFQKAIVDRKCDGLELRWTERKERTIFTTRNFSKHEFVVEYVGELITFTQALKRENEYVLARDEKGYMFYFRFQEHKWCIDATAEDGTFGRLINHSRRTLNLIPQIVPVNGVPHMVLKANRDIESGEELAYDYGDRRTLVLKTYPWLSE